MGVWSNNDHLEPGDPAYAAKGDGMDVLSSVSLKAASNGIFGYARWLKKALASCNHQGFRFSRRE